MIIPGFVNAHSHLEYAVYAGFGDGAPFGPWLKTHVERKARLAPDDMVAIARCGVADSFRSGITTVADYSFSGAGAIAAAELGLRATVYLEVFAEDPEDARRRFDERRALVEETPLVTIGVSPHAPYTCSLETYRWCLSLGIPVGTHLAESTSENDWLEHGRGELQGIPILVPPTGRRAVASLEPVLGPDLLCAHCVDVSDRRARAPRRAGRARRSLPALERATRLRGRSAHLDAPRRDAGRSRHRLARFGPVVRHVRGAARRDLRRAGPGAAPRRAHRRRRPAARDRRRQPGLCESTTGWVP